MERPKRNSQKLPDPDFICTWSDMCNFKRLTSPMKNAAKKPKIDTKARETGHPESNGLSEDTGPSTNVSPKKPVVTPTADHNKSETSASSTSKPNNMVSATKANSPKKISNKFSFSGLKIKLKSPKKGEAPKKASAPKKSDASKKSRETKPAKLPTSPKAKGKTQPQTKHKKVMSPEKRVMTVDPGVKQPCIRTGCPVKAPVCFARVSTRCVGNSYTSRWYHLSYGEHFCNMCFEWAYRGEGKHVYSKWRKAWENNSQIDGSMRLFFADQFLPYWVRCTKPGCDKWRQLSRETDFTHELVASYVCGSTNKKIVKDPCNNPEDMRAKSVFEPKWVSGLSHTPYLKSSPASLFLRKYFSDGVGLSPFYNHMMIEEEKPSGITNGDMSDSEKSCTSSDSEAEMEIDEKSHKKLSNGVGKSVKKPECRFRDSGCLPYLQPFYQPGKPAKALDFNPDFMSVEEKHLFPKYTKSQPNYLALRNIAIALWNLNCKEWLTKEHCANHVIQRGLVRIKSAMEMERIVNYLTLKGYINYGLVPKPTDLHLMPETKEHVIVIGAGAAGLSAAHHLNRVGIRVTVLEARSRIGGRIYDEHLGDVCVGTGAQIVVGSVNNPIMVLAHQADLDMREINDQCDLYEETGKVTDTNIDRRIDYHFNAMLDNVADWRQRSSSKKDVHLLAKICETHKKFVAESKLPFTEREERLLQFHISNLEYACGCDLTDVSAKNWDQNETFPQFGGKHMMVTGGYTQLFEKIVQDLDVRLNTEVTQVQYDDSQVTVMLSSGETISGSKAIVTLPLALLKKRAIFFEPVLPPKKIKAIEGLGAGIIEKIGLRFPTRFWAERTKDADCIGHVPASEETRGLFAVFYDLSPQKDSGPGILKSFVSGNGVRVIKQRSDEDIVQMCVTMLGRMFPECDIPPVESYFVSHWLEDKYSQMSYSYVPVGMSGALYEALAEPVKDRLFFAGEATNRQYPQSVTGAYMSGIREAYRIITLINEHFVPRPMDTKESKFKKARKKSKSGGDKNNVESRKKSPVPSPKPTEVVSLHKEPPKTSPRQKPTKNHNKENKKTRDSLTKGKLVASSKSTTETEVVKVPQQISPKRNGRRKSKPTKITTDHVVENLREDSPAKKQKLDNSFETGDSAQAVNMLSDDEIKKEAMDGDYSVVEVKKELEDDDEAGSLNSSFRVLGSLEFEGGVVHLDDSGELVCDSQGKEMDEEGLVVDSKSTPLNDDLQVKTARENTDIQDESRKESEKRTKNTESTEKHSEAMLSCDNQKSDRDVTYGPEFQRTEENGIKEKIETKDTKDVTEFKRSGANLNESTESECSQMPQKNSIGEDTSFNSQEVLSEKTEEIVPNNDAQNYSNDVQKSMDNESDIVDNLGKSTQIE